MEDKLILFVDDSFYSKLDLWEAMGDKFTIHTLTNGIEAYKWLSEGNIPDAIICEYYLPGFSGLNLLENIRKNPYLKEIPFVFVTERNFKKNLVKAKELGANDIYEKPLDYNRLRTRVETLIEVKSQRNKEFLPAAKQNVSVFKFIEPTLAFATFVLLSPLFMLIAAFIKFESPGPILEVKTKIGKGYRKIKDYRFRVTSWQQHWDNRSSNFSQLISYKNMECVECQKQGKLCSPLLYIDSVSICENVYKSNKMSGMETVAVKEKLTGVGKILRRTKIEFLPNLLNVMKGDMSFVGEAPIAPNVAETLTSDKDLPKLFEPVGIFQIPQPTYKELFVNISSN